MPFSLNPNFEMKYLIYKSKLTGILQYPKSRKNYSPDIVSDYVYRIRNRYVNDGNFIVWNVSKHKVIGIASRFFIDFFGSRIRRFRSFLFYQRIGSGGRILLRGNMRLGSGGGKGRKSGVVGVVNIVRLNDGRFRRISSKWFSSVNGHISAF